MDDDFQKQEELTFWQFLLW